MTTPTAPDGPPVLPAQRRTGSLGGRLEEGRIAAPEWGSGQSGVAFSQVVDQRRRTIWAGGHLTVQGADLMRGAVLLLRRGHRGRVTLDLAGVRTADDAGLQDLERLRQAVTEEGGELVLLHVPAARTAGAPAGRASSDPGVDPG